MTATEAAIRQAGRDSLVRELVNALGDLIQYPSGQYSESNGWDAAEARAYAVLTKAKEQGYA